MSGPDVTLFPESIRATNRQLVDLVARDPPNAALDAHGRRAGPAWERFQRRLAAALEAANARHDPILLNCVELFGLAED